MIFSYHLWYGSNLAAATEKANKQSKVGIIILMTPANGDTKDVCCIPLCKLFWRLNY